MMLRSTVLRVEIFFPASQHRGAPSADLGSL
jgi:hypothetical protein